MTIAICEDDKAAGLVLSAKLKRFATESGLQARLLLFQSGEALLRASQDFNIILMDWKLPGCNGMEVVKRLRARGCQSQIIFLTAYRQYVFQAFDVDALHYLLKPVREQELFACLSKAVSRIRPEGETKLTIQKGSAITSLSLDTVQYCEAIGHRIFVHATTGTYDYLGTLDGLSKQLDHRFFRCHRSYIVNLSFVAGREGDTARMENGETVFISRRNLQEFTKRLLSALRNEVM